MKIVYMGTPYFAACSLLKLIEAGYEIPLVVTQPDKKGNRNKIIYSDVKEVALQHGIDIAQPVSVKKDEDFINLLKRINPDISVVAALGQIIPKEVLEIPKYGCINVHGSVLPKLRGASPMQAAILCGMDKSGVTIMRIDEGVDTGDIIDCREVESTGLNINELTKLLAEEGAVLLEKVIRKIENGKATYTPQDDSKATTTKLIKRENGLTDFSEPATEIERKIRAYMAWPTCYSYLDGKQVKFFKAEVISEKDVIGFLNKDSQELTEKSVENLLDSSDTSYGTVIRITKNYYTIRCKEGALNILEQQLQGKKRMSAADFMRGHKLQIGDRFTK